MELKIPQESLLELLVIGTISIVKIPPTSIKEIEIQ
jgi:hypothetical protein